MKRILFLLILVLFSFNISAQKHFMSQHKYRYTSPVIEQQSKLTVNKNSYEIGYSYILQCDKNGVFNSKFVDRKFKSAFKKAVKTPYQVDLLYFIRNNVNDKSGVYKIYITDIHFVKNNTLKYIYIYKTKRKSKYQSQQKR